MEVAIEVSVIIPVYNASPWLAECLASLVGQVDESGQPFPLHTSCEVCIFDDSSTDDSPKIVQEWLSKLQVMGIFQLCSSVI